MSVSASQGPSCRTPLMKNVGVPLTPLRTPLMNEQEVVHGPELALRTGRPVTVVGNSLGGAISVKISLK